MTCRGNIIRASGANPFDRTYNVYQQEFDKNILSMLSGILNVNVSLVNTPLVTDLSAYGRDEDNWIVEQLINGSAEISSTSLILTADFSNSVSYSLGIAIFRPQLYYKAKSLRDDSNIYLAPFSLKLWLCLIAALILLTLALVFILRREAKLPHEISYDVFARLLDIQEDRDADWTDNPPATTEESLLQREKWEMGEILLVCLGAVCQQGSARDPSTNAARLLILVLFVLAVVGYTAYSASIISLISLFPSTENEEALNSKHFSSEGKTLWLSTSKIGPNLKLGFDRIDFTSLEKGFEKVVEDDDVFVGDKDASLTSLHAQNFNTDIRCTIGRAFLGVKYHRVFAVRNNSSLKENINNGILKLKQFGLLERERRNIFRIQPPCTLSERASRTNFVSFNKNDVRSVVNLFQFGLFLSILFFIIENLLHCCPKEIKKIFLQKIKGKFNKSNKISSEKNLFLENESAKIQRENQKRDAVSHINKNNVNNPLHPFLL